MHELKQCSSGRLCKLSVYENDWAFLFTGLVEMRTLNVCTHVHVGAQLLVQRLLHLTVTCTYCVFGCFVQIYLLFCVDLSVDWYFLRQRLADKVICGI